MKFIVTGVATQQQQPPHVVCPRQRCANSTSSSTAEDDDDVFLESGGATLPLLPASPGAAPFAVSTAHPSQSLYGSPGGGSLQRYGPTSVVGDAASIGREARGSSSRRAPGRPPSLQSGQSFDENESLASSSGCGGVHVATTRRSVRSDDGILFVGGPGGSGFGGDTCSSVSAGSSERLSAAASADRRPAGDECDLYEDDWESGYASGSFNPGQLLQQGARDAEVLKAWLGHLHFDGYSYADNFLQAGYDMPTVSRMTPEDLTAIGITVPEHRRKLTTWISQLKIHDGLPDYRPASVLEWLQLLHLEQYYGALKNECDSVAALTKITWEDLEEIGIKKLGHQKKIMLAVEQLKKIGKRQSCSSQSSNSSEPHAASAGLASVTPQRQPSCRRFVDAASCGGVRAHHRSVSGEMVQSTEGFCAGQRPACRQLSCDSAMTRSLMLQQTVSSGVSRSSSGNTVTTATVSTGDYAQPRNLPFSRPDDSTSLNSSEDSASSAGSCGGSGHYSQPVTHARRAGAMANPPLPCSQAFDPPPMYPGAGGGWAAPDKRRHLSASSGGSGGGSIVGSSPPQYSTLARQAVTACGGRTGRGYRQVSAEESPYARLPVRESTPPLAAGVPPGANHDSPFAGFPSPYAHIPNGVQANGLNASAKASMVSPPPSDGLVPSSRLSAQQSRLPLPPPHASSPFELAGNDRDASPPALMSSVVGDDDCDATSSSSDCELDGQEFPPMAPPIAFNMQHMRVPRQPRTIAQLPVVAERPTIAAPASTAVAGRTPARDTGSSAGGAVGSDIGAIGSRRTYGGVGSSGQSVGASDSLAESCIGAIPFANENAGTIRQRPASSSSSTCSGGDGNCRIGDEWDGSGAPSAVSAASSGQAGRRSLRMPRDLATSEGSIDDARRFARPVMHVQPVVISDQRYSSPALPALSALQRHIFEEDDDAKKKELLADAAECTRCSTDLDAMLERDPDAS